MANDSKTDDLKELIEKAISDAMSESKKTHALDLTTTEKSIVGLITAIVISLLLWTVNTTNDTAKRVAVIESQMVDIKGSTGDRYTASQARQHEEEMERRVSRLEAAHGLE